MKKRDDWVRQAVLDKKLDQLVQDRMCNPEDINIYDAAKAFGMEPNGSFYQKVRDWKRRRIAERSQHEVDVSPQALTEFRKAIDAFSEEATNHFLRELRKASSDVHGAASLRVAAAERRTEEEEAVAKEAIDSWMKVEEYRDALQQRIEDLERELEEARSREERLLGRLEECHAIMQAQEAEAKAGKAKGPDEREGSKPQVAKHPSAPEATAGLTKQQAGPVGEPQGNKPPLPLDARDVVVGARKVQNPSRDDRPSASEPGRPVGGQSELPLASKDPSPSREDR